MAKINQTDITTVDSTSKFMVRRGLNDFAAITYSDLSAQMGGSTPGVGAGNIADTDKIIVTNTSGAKRTYTFAELKTQLSSTLTPKASTVTANLTETKVDGSVQAELIDMKESINKNHDLAALVLDQAAPNSTIILANDTTFLQWNNIEIVNWSV